MEPPMDPLVQAWDAIPETRPIELIARKSFQSERMLVANVRLERGCHVAPHRHESEQVAIIMSGRVRWSLGDAGTPEYRQVEVGSGHVVHLPSNFTHGVDALEDTDIIDVLSPPGPMGIDRQGVH